jgi:proteasome lid subunit RPN8/RPN11
MDSRIVHQGKCPNLSTKTVEPAKPIFEVVVDKKVLASFRRRALKAYPNEYIETIWGKLKGNTAYVFVFHAMEHEATPVAIKLDSEHEHHEEESMSSTMELLGTIHTHPGKDSIPFPSETDIQTHLSEAEPIMGIMAINKRGKRRFTSVNFFCGSGKPVLTTIAE